MRVVVLRGGRSLERQVSLRSGARVEEALSARGHTVAGIDPGPDLVARLRDERPEVVFVALHGVGGEDGTVQELLEILGVPYTGSPGAACRSMIDKALAKQRLRDAGVPTPDWFSFSNAAFSQLGAADALGAIQERLGFPLVVKPVHGGSSLGVKFAADAGAVPQALIAAFSYDDRVVLEHHVGGRELAVAVLDGEVLPIVEAIPRDEDRFSYDARYEIGRTSYLCPAGLAAGERKAVEDAATASWEALGCEGFARIDLMLGPDGPAVLEANAVPGLTDTSLVPMAAEAAGVGFEELCERIIGLAVERGRVSTGTRAG